MNMIFPKSDISIQVKDNSRVTLPHRQIAMRELFPGKTRAALPPARGEQPVRPDYSGYSSRPPDALSMVASRSAGDVIAAVSGGKMRPFSTCGRGWDCNPPPGSLRRHSWWRGSRGQMMTVIQARPACQLNTSPFGRLHETMLMKGNTNIDLLMCWFTCLFV